MSNSDARNPLVVLAGCSLIMTGFGAYMLGPASLVPILIESFDITSTDAGLVFSASYLGWLVFQLPGGFLLDRHDNRWLVLGAVLILSTATLLATGTETFWGFLGTRALGGVAGAILFTANVNIVGHAFSRKRRGLATGTVLGSALGGMALGQFSSPIVASVVDWPIAFVAYAGLSVVGIGLLYLGSPRSIRSGDRVSVGDFLRTLTDRHVLLLSMAAFSVNGLFIFLNSWIPTYATDVLLAPLTVAGTIGAMVPVAGMVGRPSGGWLSDYVGSRRLVSLGSLILAIPLLLAIPVFASWIVLSGILLLNGFALQIGFGTYYAFAQELVPEDVTGSSMASVTAFVVLSGLVAPPLGGFLKTTFSWDVAFGVFAMIGLLGLGAIYVVSEG